ncbi:S-adenosyl-L-methionine-dependent methyltransferase [Lentinula edodes]|uniref:S-adenosyl-L-methionine-dependent methyltransferase n=1 Tax=Lentinula edodes TaxID=5353 RepID=UPI001E8D5755|nr:S-adenosyl-L-methionine-dependent methyltransferase [Lentinula edodes]KAH7874886.1 S-adenosyl-L-methionine-dependent methyltransferase [Lentinula edodes]
MANFDNSHVTALTALINDAVQDVIAEYAAVGQAIPSLNSLKPGPFQVPAETPARLMKAIKIIEAACAQLTYTVSPPGSVMLNKALEHGEAACLSVVTEARMADLLLDQPAGLPASKLADIAGIHAGKLTRILRLLATKHCFKEVQPGVFANNRLSMKLLSADPTSALVLQRTDDGLLASAYLNKTMSKDDNGIPYQRATGFPYFDFDSQPDGLKRSERFARTMVGWGQIFGKEHFLPQAYPWSVQPPETTICDVAGGNGFATMALLKAHPHLNLVLQDQTQIIDRAREFWVKQHPSAVQKERVKFVPFDFFKDAPVRGCDIYYLSFILHDWQDRESKIILNNIRKAMKPESKLIIHEIVLRNALSNTDEFTAEAYFDVAPKPLLPNYGVARARTYELDIAMMTLLGSQERTLAEYVNLCHQCGLRFSKLYEAGEMDLMEFSLV